MGSDRWVTAALRRVWHITDAQCLPIWGGAHSSTWLVTTDQSTHIAKWVAPSRRARFEAGLAAAERVAASGTPSGAPVRTADGSLTTLTEGGVLSLLRFVPGRALDGTSAVDQTWWGDTLAQAHRALAGFAHPGLTRFHWLRSDSGHLDVEPWIRPAVSDAIHAVARLTVTDQLTYGVLHGHPAADSFRLDRDTGRTGLIDWGSAGCGPLVYDVARAVMFAGGTDRPDDAADLIDAYVAAGQVGRDEIDAALPVMLRFCWAVQADFFAHRITTGDLTGAVDPEDNWKGLRDARAVLVS